MYQTEESFNSLHDFNIVNFYLAVGTHLRVIALRTLPTHDHMPTVKENDVSAIGVANYAHLVLTHRPLRNEVGTR